MKTPQRVKVYRLLDCALKLGDDAAKIPSTNWVTHDATQKISIPSSIIENPLLANIEFMFDSDF